MLQFNHVSINSKGRNVLVDQTFQFKEGSIYILLGQADDFITIFKCINKERNTESGQIVTWQDAITYNAADDTLLAERITVNEYLTSLVKITQSEKTYDEILEDVDLNKEVKDVLISELDDVSKASLRLAAMLAIDPYIMTYGEPFADLRKLCEIIDRYSEEKVFIIGTSQEEKAKKISLLTGAEIISLGEGRFNKLNR